MTFSLLGLCFFGDRLSGNARCRDLVAIMKDWEEGSVQTFIGRESLLGSRGLGCVTALAGLFLREKQHFGCIMLVIQWKWRGRTHPLQLSNC